MIETISNWAGELVVAMIISTLIEMLLPDNKTKKYVKTLIGTYIVFCIISPFINQNDILSFESIEKELESYSKEVKIQESEENQISMENLYIEEFKKDVIKNVENLGYKVKKCEVDIQIDATKENAGINKIKLIIGEKKVQNNDDEEVKNEIKIEEVEKVEISINNNQNENNITENIEENLEIKEVKTYLSNYYEISENRVNVTQD